MGLKFRAMELEILVWRGLNSSIENIWACRRLIEALLVQKFISVAIIHSIMLVITYMNSADGRHFRFHICDKQGDFIPVLVIVYSHTHKAITLSVPNLHTFRTVKVKNQPYGMEMKAWHRWA